jgi:[ribosomal protein S5]-alanine N-acetyltransferase
MRLETERLILRDPRIDDALDIFNNYSQDEEVTKYLVWKPHRNLETTRTFIESCITRNKLSENLIFSVFHKVDNKVIGMIDFKLDGFKATFGYVLAKHYWNMGLMTEAMKPPLAYVLKLEIIKRVWATHHINNDASGNVMKKLGMELEGILRKYTIYPNLLATEPEDVKIYSIVK